MGKVKFKYNPKTFKYEPYYLRGKALQDRVAIFLALSLVLGGVFYVAYTRNFPSLREQLLRKKNVTLKAEMQIVEERIIRDYTTLKTLVEKDDNTYRVILDSSPLSPEIREAGTGGSEKIADEDVKQHGPLYHSYLTVTALENKVNIETQSYQELTKTLQRKVHMWASRPAIQPISNKQLDRLHLTYGSRLHPILKIVRDHKGLDFAAAKGIPVHATGDAKVITAHYSDSYGNVIYLDHGHGYETRYAHLSGFAVKLGEKIKRGQVIGYVGNTGTSVSAHLHYEILFNGQHVNPINFFQRDLSNKEYEHLIENASTDVMALD